MRSSPAARTAPTDFDGLMGCVFAEAVEGGPGAGRCYAVDRRFLVSEPASSAEERGRTAGG